MFLRQDAGGEGVGGVIGLHRYAGLAKDRAVVQQRRDHVHGAAVLCVAGFYCAGVGV